MIYWYEYKHRGFSLGCQPSGFIDRNENLGRFGWIAYNRALTDKELEEYELIAICPSCNKNKLRESGGNALSRKDNKTEICSQCGTKEALIEFLERHD